MQALTKGRTAQYDNIQGIYEARRQTVGEINSKLLLTSSNRQTPGDHAYSSAKS